MKTPRAVDDLNSILVAGEYLESWALQIRLFALTHRRVLVGATSGRFLSISRNLLAGFSSVSFRWQDLKTVTIRVGIFGADLMVVFDNSTDLAFVNQTHSILHFKGLNKSQALEVYRFCQAQDQSWREKRRVRELEEIRAQSGGLQQIFGVQGGLPPVNSIPPGDSLRRLQEANQMLEAKLITDSEYEALKARIINSA